MYSLPCLCHLAACPSSASHRTCFSSHGMEISSNRTFCRGWMKANAPGSLLGAEPRAKGQSRSLWVVKFCLATGLDVNPAQLVTAHCEKGPVSFSWVAQPLSKIGRMLRGTLPHQIVTHCCEVCSSTLGKVRKHLAYSLRVLISQTMHPMK